MEPVLADKEVILTALNVKAMSFTDDDDEAEEEAAAAAIAEESEGVEEVEELKDNAKASELAKRHLLRRAETKEADRARRNSLVGDIMEKRTTRRTKDGLKTAVPIVVDLAFASNVRFLDDHELHLDNVELYKVRRGGAWGGRGAGRLPRVASSRPDTF